MQAVEFDSCIENGVIAVPAQYRTLLTNPVRVIVFAGTDRQIMSQNTQKKKALYSLDIDMTGFKFNRDEANER